MTKPDRLALIKIRHRRMLRSWGVPVYLTKSERIAIDRAMDLGETVEDIARRHGMTERQVGRVRVNRAFYSGIPLEPLTLSKWQRKTLEAL